MKSDATKKTKKAEAVKGAKTHPLIRGARMTEKSALGAEKGIYTFNVMPDATKSEIKKAIKMLYGVTPSKVAMTQITPKFIFRRGVLGRKSGGKKAVVYLKKGETITFV